MKISKAALVFLWTVVIPGLILAIISSDIEAYFGGDRLRMMTAIILLLLLTLWSSYIYSVRNKKEFLKQYDLFKETRELKPEDLDFHRIKPGESVKSRLRPYYDIYIPRTAIPFERRDDKVTSIDPSQIFTEEQLSSFLESSSGLLLIGGPTD